MEITKFLIRNPKYCKKYSTEHKKYFLHLIINDIISSIEHWANNKYKFNENFMFFISDYRNNKEYVKYTFWISCKDLYETNEDRIIRMEFENGDENEYFLMDKIGMGKLEQTALIATNFGNLTEEYIKKIKLIRNDYEPFLCNDGDDVFDYINNKWELSLKYKEYIYNLINDYLKKDDNFLENINESKILQRSFIIGTFNINAKINEINSIINDFISGQIRKHKSMWTFDNIYYNPVECSLYLILSWHRGYKYQYKFRIGTHESERAMIIKDIVNGVHYFECDVSKITKNGEYRKRNWGGSGIMPGNKKLLNLNPYLKYYGIWEEYEMVKNRKCYFTGNNWNLDVFRINRFFELFKQVNPKLNNITSLEDFILMVISDNYNELEIQNTDVSENKNNTIINADIIIC